MYIFIKKSHSILLRTWKIIIMITTSEAVNERLILNSIRYSIYIFLTIFVKRYIEMLRLK